MYQYMFIRNVKMIVELPHGKTMFIEVFSSLLHAKKLAEESSRQTTLAETPCSA